jgi:hypothetical protein
MLVTPNIGRALLRKVRSSLSGSIQDGNLNDRVVAQASQSGKSHKNRHSACIVERLREAAG